MSLPTLASISADNRQLHAIARAIGKAIDTRSVDIAESIVVRQATIARQLDAAYGAVIKELLSTAGGSHSTAQLFQHEQAALRLFLSSSDLQSAHDALALIPPRGHCP